ncbi:MAG: NTP transferase domain-containing protein [Deltaproteobacteria bacterium]|nr:NTP transferase domain-containing protein [Deltaproteobacteria bacterium]
MTVAIVLAAGAGSRLGHRAKATVSFDGRTASSMVLAAIPSSVSSVVVVSGAHSVEVEEAFGGDSRVRVVHNSGWERGQSSSLRVGLAEMGLEADVLLFPVDYPMVRKATVEGLLRRWDELGAPVGRLVPVFHGAHGHPVVFSHLLIPELMSAAAAESARSVFRRGRTFEWVTDDEATTRDMDTPEDVLSLLRLHRDRLELNPP